MKKLMPLLWAGVLLILPVTVWGGVPKLINFQGVLKDSGGNPVADSTYSVTFTIYDAASGGVVLWTETQSVTTTSGLFIVLLGASNPVPDSVFQGSDRWLGIAVSPDPELSPRQQLVSVGYSYRVNSVDGALGGTISGDINIMGKATIGSGNTNTGSFAFVAGTRNTATSPRSTIGGGDTNTITVISDAATISGGKANIANNQGATIGGGHSNIVSGDRATIGGGGYNKARGVSSVVSGGGGSFPSDSNSAFGNYSAIGGGLSNVAQGLGSKVGGGSSNKATGGYSTVGGGIGNIANGTYSTIGGGIANNALDSVATVGGGVNNTAGNPFATVGGGYTNAANGLYSTVAGGQSNLASEFGAAVVGGGGNKATGSHSFVGGGMSNVASGPYYATVAGGDRNSATGNWSAIPGGQFNKAAGSFSFAAGRLAKALHGGTFVWADTTAADFASTGINQFLIRAGGGVGIGTNNPEVALQVDQDAEVSTFTGDNNQGLRISGTNTNDRWVLLGFDGGQGKNISQIGSRQTGAGSFLSFGTSSSFVIGITNEAMTIDPEGKVGIGVPAPAHPLHLASGAHCTAGGTWTNASSRSYKTDIRMLEAAEYGEILEKLENLDVVRFKYKADPGREHLGLIAEDVPDEISSEDRKGIPTADAIAFLMAAAKAQQAKMEELENRIKELKAEQK